MKKRERRINGDAGCGLFSPAEALNGNQSAIWRWESGDGAPRKHKQICRLISERRRRNRKTGQKKKTSFFFSFLCNSAKKTHLSWETFVFFFVCFFPKSIKPFSSFTGGNDSSPLQCQCTGGRSNLTTDFSFILRLLLLLLLYKAFLHHNK